MKKTKFKVHDDSDITNIIDPREETGRIIIQKKLLIQKCGFEYYYDIGLRNFNPIQQCYRRYNSAFPGMEISISLVLGFV